MAIIVNILLVLFVPVCILLILMVLLQAGKGGGLSGAFGGLGTNQPFLGARGTVDFLSKLTIYLAIAFMSLALILSITYGPSRTIKVKEEAPPAVETQGTTETSTQTPAKTNRPAQTINVPIQKSTETKTSDKQTPSSK
ncbi:MAG: preprotein translocase subunit SecG [Candidatus Poribacteria bacterium]